ncbi:MAG TPA: hypothetical protein VN718_02765, partial [Rhizomicrobium sp.]|nr:hypothetical protein [Rhizomicrobium sp.]
LAAFRLKNWARWALAILFVAMQAIPLILSARVGRAQDFIRGEYLAPEADAVFVLFVIAIALSFTGDARQAFARPK